MSESLAHQEQAEGLRPTFIRLDQDENGKEVVGGIFGIGIDFDMDKANLEGKDKGYRFVYPQEYEEELAQLGKRVRRYDIGRVVLEDIEQAG